MKFSHALASFASEVGLSGPVLRYKDLKKLIAKFAQSASTMEPHGIEHATGSMDEDMIEAAVSAMALTPPPVSALLDAEECFLRAVNEDLERFNEYYIDEEERNVIRVRALQDLARGRPSDVGSFVRACADLRAELLLLLHWSNLNFCALYKIFKKYDKTIADRSGAQHMKPLMSNLLSQPFASNKVIARLVRRLEALMLQYGPAAALSSPPGSQRRISPNSPPTEAPPAAAERPAMEHDASAMDVDGDHPAPAAATHPHSESLHPHNHRASPPMAVPHHMGPTSAFPEAPPARRAPIPLAATPSTYRALPFPSPPMRHRAEAAQRFWMQLQAEASTPSCPLYSAEGALFFLDSASRQTTPASSSPGSIASPAGSLPNSLPTSALQRDPLLHAAIQSQLMGLASSYPGLAGPNSAPRGGSPTGSNWAAAPPRMHSGSGAPQGQAAGSLAQPPYHGLVACSNVAQPQRGASGASPEARLG